VIVVRDERDSDGAPLFAIGEVIDRHERGGQDTARTVSELAAEMGKHPIRDFTSPNNVHLQYYDWSCVENCDQPDPPQPKLFGWVSADHIATTAKTKTRPARALHACFL